MEEQISDDVPENNNDHDQSISSQFQIMKSKMDHKQKDLEVSNKQRIIDKLLTQVEAKILINDKAAKWQITAQCEN